LLKGGILDGPEGFRYAVLQSFYEYMIVLKTKELAARKKATEYEVASEPFGNVGAVNVKHLITSFRSDD
jgi:hypothetical protein